MSDAASSRAKPAASTSRRAAFGGRLTTTASDDHGAPPQPQSHPRRNNSDHGKRKQRSNSRSDNRAFGETSVNGGTNPGGRQQLQQTPETLAQRAAQAAAQDDGETDDGAVCFICAEVAQLWALGECNHRTCHTCSIRLRALYKKKECTFCKTDLPRVIFTADADKAFSEYSPQSLPFSDSKLGISFETREQLDDSIALLRFNCPEPTCEDVRQSWPDLKCHVKAAHNTQICDLCSFNKKIFAHEHALYNQTDMRQHLNNDHPQCDFCRRNFYDSDQLYTHCREKHEECFICIRQGIRHQYHLDYQQLEAHFKSAHFMCPHPECLQQKFVVFESELDLQAHAVETHGASLADQKARKDARRIETNFTYQSVGESSRSGGRNNNNSGRRGDRRAIDQQPSAAFVRTAEDASTSRANRIVPGLGAAASSSARRAGFGSSLTHRPATSAVSSRAASGADPETKAQHEAVMRKVEEAVTSEAKVTSFKLAVRSFRGGEMSADDLVDQLWNIFDQKEDTAAPVVTGVADLFAKEDPEKRTALITAWRDLRDQQNQFPSLAPLDPSLPSSVRHATSRSLNNRSSRQSRPAVWDRVEQAASSTRPAAATNPFPALASAPNAGSVPGIRSKASHTPTPWLSHASATPSSSTPSSGLPSRSSTPISRPTPYSASAPKPASLASKMATGTRAAGAPSVRSGFDFPALPVSSVEADKRARIRAALSKPNRTIVDDPSPGAHGANGRSGENSEQDDYSWGLPLSSSSSAIQQQQQHRQQNTLPSNGTVDEAGPKGKKGKKGKVLLLSHGSMRG
ncbi:hypothetical protein OIV83_004446 [Microbotryomycetes sp. JL201]|nr:hypothetical protein OIV83_004446 [Microbotryomycetes sp. JL201]